MRLLTLCVSFALLGALAGCQAESDQPNAAAEHPYGTNNTLDPADITGSGTSGNITGLPGFARGTSHSDD